MADADHSPAFWHSVALTFRSDHAVAFDLYNEPHDISWGCLRSGCMTRAGWRTAGMQQLVDAVRSAHATQPVLVEGLDWAGGLSDWLEYAPYDPAQQLVASVHIYNFSGCHTHSCWSSSITPVAPRFPVVSGELGSTGCSQGFVDKYMDWADAHHVSYLL